MYESCFGLVRRPFVSSPDPGCWFPARNAQKAFDALSQCLQHGQGVAVLTAPPGTGTTVLCRKLAQGLNRISKTITLPHGQFSTAKSLLQAILYELERPYLQMDEEELRLELVNALRQLPPDQGFLTLILDEAHLLEVPALEEIRTLVTVADEGAPSIRVLLAGQLPLEEQLARPELAGLNQRIACQTVLEPLTRAESLDYVAFRLRWAGGDVDEIFSPEALQLIAQVSDGLPRCLNQLSDHCLLMAAMAEERPVSEPTVREALNDLKHLPLPWNLPAELEHGTQMPPEKPAESARDELPESWGEGDEWTGGEEEGPTVEGGGTEQGSDLDAGPRCEEWASLDPQREDREMSSIEVGAETHSEPAAEEEWSEYQTHRAEISSIDEGRAQPLEAPLDRNGGRDQQNTPSAASSAADPGEFVIDDAAGLAEEAVVDPYALMDAGRSSQEEEAPPAVHPVAPTVPDPDARGIGPANAEPVPESSPAVAEVGSEDGTESSQDDDAPSEPGDVWTAADDCSVADFQDSPGPQALIDQLMPLLDHAISTDTGPLRNEPDATLESGGSGISSVPHLRDAGPHHSRVTAERRKGDPDGVPDAPSALVSWTSEPGDQTMETQIGAEVVDICLETRDVVEEILAGPPAAELPQEPVSSETMSRNPYRAPQASPGSRFDVVQPEEGAAWTPQEAGGIEWAPHERPRRYGLLFSRLRNERRS